MRTQDMYPGQEVAVKRGSLVHQGVVVATGGYRKTSSYRGPGIRQDRDGRGVAVALPTRYQMGRYSEVPSWYPDVVQPQNVLCPWAQHLIREQAQREFREAERQRQDARREAIRATNELIKAKMEELGLDFRITQNYNGEVVMSNTTFLSILVALETGVLTGGKR